LLNVLNESLLSAEFCIDLTREKEYVTNINKIVDGAVRIQ